MGRTKVLETYMGKVHKLAHNPNKMTDGRYTKLVESLMRKDDEGHEDIEMMAVKRLTVWKVPDKLPDDGGIPWPFAGQEGKLVMLGGNWRYRALEDMGYDQIPDAWVAIAKYKDGQWWSAEHAERFILLDNNPDGISGENDHDVLMRQFREETLRAVGIDYAGMPQEWQEEKGEKTADEVEAGEHGEQDQKLADFIQRREESRKNLDEMLDMGFYTVTVFETHDQKMEYLEFLREKYGVEANREVFVNGFKMAEALGKKIEFSGLRFAETKPNKALQEMAMDGTEAGWEVNSGARPEGEEPGEGDEEKFDDGTGVDDLG